MMKVLYLSVILFHIFAVSYGLDIGDQYDIQGYSASACENRPLDIFCPRGYGIKLITASFGRVDNETCVGDLPENSDKSTSQNCDVSDVFDRLATQCDDQNYCYIDTTDQDLDPNGECPDVYKYLNIEFNCALPIENILSCANSQVTLSCSGDEVIAVLDAFYGRRDATTCADVSVTSSDAACTSNYTRAAVGVLCNGQQSCDIHVAEGLLGNECGGDGKYLEVAYACTRCGNAFGNDEACGGFAETGECEANPSWMTAYCRQACFDCGYADTCSNVGGDADCGFWASRGRCGEDAIAAQCRRACNRCDELLHVPPGTLSPQFKEVCEADAVIVQCDVDYYVRINDATFGRTHNDTCANEGVDTLDCPSNETVLIQMRQLCEGRQFCWFEPAVPVFGDPCPGTSKMGRVDYSCQRCYNAFLDSECEAKAELGECESNREWMMDHCYRTCTNCYTPVDCYNSFGNDVDCDYYAVTGECEKNPDWMHYNCELACQTCHIFTPVFPGSTFEVRCEGEEVSLECPQYGEYISVDVAFFGRDSTDTCPHENATVTDCAAEGATEIVGEVCGGRKDCSFEASPLSWGNPCEGVNKLARIKYHCQECENFHGDEFCEAKAAIGACDYDYHFMQQFCFKTCSKCSLDTCGNEYGSERCDYWAMNDECTRSPDWMNDNCTESCGACPLLNLTALLTTTIAPASLSTTEVVPSTSGADFVDFTETEHQLSCEALILHPRCDPGYYVWIQDFFFGRHSLDLCPGDFENVTDCSAEGAMAIVQEYCNGQAECFISAHTRVFDDPCPGTFKFAEVDYACHTCANAEDDSLCEYRQSLGHCHSRYPDMMQDCFKTCSGCDLIATSECENAYNSEEDCDYWAMGGECELNQNWMHDNCNRSCYKCQGPRPATPTTTLDPGVADLLDKQEAVYMDTCEGGSIELVCTEDYVIRLDIIYFGRYGNETCAHETVTGDEDCNSPSGLFDGIMQLCNGRQGCYYEALTEIWGDPCPGTMKQAHIQYTCQNCLNVLPDAECEQMRDEDKCAQEYSHMMDNCFKTCSQCHESGCSNSYGVSADCDFWALKGYCDTNPAFMYANCEESCGVCVDKTCPSGFKGEGCAEFDCSEVENCNGRGECTGANTCTCNSGYGGTTCADFNCNGVNECSGNGRCYGPNQCQCYPYFSGDGCNECGVQFDAQTNCMPCPACQQGTCEDNELPLGPMIDVTPNQDGGTYKQVQREGVGTATPQPGDTLYTHYHGTLTDGTLFDASRPRGNMFLFKIGTNYVIQGWEVALPTMKKGEVATLTIRSDYAYGSSGLGSSIPPDATLVIRVELFDFRDTCSDVWERGSCLDRQAAGECETNVDQMTLNCERTCKFCGEPESYPATCLNGYDPEEDCEYWSGIGECAKNPDWMRDNCNRACNYCGDQCTNALTEEATDANCDHWAEIGECDLNRDWMRRNCGRSCGFCDNPPPSTDECINEHVSDVNCDYWARHGECDIEASRRWMHTLCRKSCGLCDAIASPMVWAYVGCYADVEPAADLEHVAWTNSDTSSLACMERCYQLGYKYSATRNGHTCLCGNSYGSYGEARGACVVQCQGTSGDYCGGQTANSVWSVTEGTCSCDDGWSGELCDIPESVTTSTTTTSRTTRVTQPSTAQRTESSTQQTMTSTEASTSTQSTTIGPITSRSPTPSTTSTAGVTTSQITEGTSTMVPEISTIIVTTPTTPTPTTKTISDVSMTTTVIGPSSTVEPPSDNELPLVVRVLAEWRPEYADFNNADTLFFLQDLRANLLEYYQRILDGVSDIVIISLREGSVIVEHRLVFDSAGSSALMEQNMCDLSYDMRDGVNIGDYEIESIDQLEGDCDWHEDYCKNDGTLYRTSSGKYKCDCKSGYKGKKCEDQELLAWQLALLIIGCCAVPIAVVVISCLVVHKRNHQKRERLKSERRARENGFFPQSNSSTEELAVTQFQGKSKSTVRSARKLFRDSNSNSELADKEGFVPRQI